MSKIPSGLMHEIISDLRLRKENYWLFRVIRTI